MTDVMFVVDDLHLKFRAYMFLDRKRQEDALTPGELRRWMKLKRILNQELSPGVSFEGVDRRESVRLPARVRVSFHDADQLRECLMTKLSRGGLFIATETPLEIGTSFDLHIALESSGETLEVPVEVVSLNARPDRPVFEPGMGLRFREMSAAMREKVDRFYEDKLHELGDRARGLQSQERRKSA